MPPAVVGAHSPGHRESAVDQSASPWDWCAGYSKGGEITSPLTRHEHQEGLQQAEAGGKMLGQQTHVGAPQNLH